MVDNAIVRFGSANTLEKFYFNDRNAKLYIPQDDKDYAVVCSDKQGEIPVNFEAKEDGNYKISVKPENVELAYLHLIDNKTGADVDLLAGCRDAKSCVSTAPEYTFTAKTTDYASRFKLVFVAEGEDGSSTGSEPFAFFSNGSWVITNEGEATLQVIDVTGRILSNETISGSVSKTIDAAPGVYILKLNDKVQKIVVR